MNFNKSILSIALSVAAVMFVGCSTDGYWDKAPIDSEVKYTCLLYTSPSPRD
mgnify:CR=1 FL=1